ncbi:MAG TPA: YafY family protein [Ktedonobacteraceae bacterium]|nr:YafY family protein [Ktedonobacteraceae bacterium]
MNRTDRLLAIVLELQRKGRQRAQDLAATFETSKRTIYRDIEALCEAGVPLISIPGKGYSLMQGYFLPPLSFTTEEATMLMLGSDFMAQNFDAQYREAALSAGRKIDGVLPEKLRDEVHYLQNSIQFVARGTMKNPAGYDILQQLRRAIIEHTTVRFRYYARHRANDQDELNTREVDPYSLTYMLNSWYLIAYDHARQDIRSFRFDRIENLELLTQTFKRLANSQEITRELRQDRPGQIIVRAIFEQEIARWVREGRSYYTVSEEDTPEGLLVTLRIRQENEVLQWLLSWGQRVRVLEPESLRQRLLEEAQGMLKNLQKLPAQSAQSTD